MSELEQFSAHKGYHPHYMDADGGYLQLLKVLRELETRIEALEKAVSTPGRT